MKILIRLIGIFLFSSQLFSAEEPAFLRGDLMTFEIKAPGKTKPPFFIVFPNGKTATGEDASGVLRILKKFRGRSWLYETEDAKPGMMVVFNTLAFVPNEDNTYHAIFEGEYNAVKVPVDDKQMDSLLQGKPTEMRLHSVTKGGLYPLYYEVESDTDLSMQLVGDRLQITRVAGNCTIREINHWRETTKKYESNEIVIEDKGKLLYEGNPVAEKEYEIINE